MKQNLVFDGCYCLESDKFLKIFDGKPEAYDFWTKFFIENYKSTHL